jgi:hypothetical protein
MPTFKDLQLTEISDSAYTRLKQRLGLQAKESHPNANGVARITRPLILSSFEELLELFNDSPQARRATAKISSKNWMRLTPEDMTQRSMSELCEIAQNDKLMFLSFFGGENNEIGFEPLEREGGIVSTSLCVPGDLRHFYDWNGSDNDYHMIWGLYEPLDVKSYAAARGGVKPIIESSKGKKVSRVLDLLKELSSANRQINP